VKELAFKLALPALVLVEVLLVRTGRLELRDAVLIVVGLEALLLLVAGRQVLAARRSYRTGRSAGLDFWQAAEEGLAVLLPRPAAKVVVNEPQLLACLFAWIFRRAKPGPEDFTYHQESYAGAFVLTIALVAPVELLLVHLIIPWTWLKWLHLILGVYAILWLLALRAATATLPHRLESAGLRLRYGVFARGFVPYSRIERVERRRLKSPAAGDGLRTGEDCAYLAVNGKTNVSLHLNAPASVEGFLRPTPPVQTIHLAVDEPGRLARELQKRLEAARTPVPNTPAHPY
jgi:hypothetical protein